MAIYYNPGVPGAGTSKVDTLTIGGAPTSGTFSLNFQGKFTSAISWSNNNTTLLGNINSAIQALNSIQSTGAVATAGTLTVGIGTIIISYGGILGVLNFTGIQIGAKNLIGTNPTLSISETTPGIPATHRDANLGDQCIDSSNGNVYINQGVLNAPVWGLVTTT